MDLVANAYQKKEINVCLFNVIVETFQNAIRHRKQIDIEQA